MDREIGYTKEENVLLKTKMNGKEDNERIRAVSRELENKMEITKITKKKVSKGS